MGRQRLSAGWRLLADNLRGSVELLIQCALFFTAQATAALRGHIVFFLLNSGQPLVQTSTLGRRVEALGNMAIDAMRFVVDAHFDLLGATHGGDMRIWGGRRRRRDHTSRQQTAAGNECCVLNDFIHVG